MKLDADQQQKVTAWINEGLKLSEIQSRLVSEFGLSVTYMEVRFLMDDLKLKPKEKERPAPAPPSALTAASPPPAAPVPPGPAGASQPPSAGMEDEAGAGTVSVTVDQLARPGALVSGSVTFSDGNIAQWQVDQMGRLGLVPRLPGYRPSQEDLLSFQAELQGALAKLGF